MKKCPECSREIPEYWAVPFTARWGRDPKTDQFRAYRFRGREFADCQSCCDRPWGLEDLALMGVTWGGLRTSEGE